MACEFMDVITTIIYIILFIIMMVFVFSIGMLRKFMPKREVILVILVAFLIGSMGGAFFLEPIYQELPSAVGTVEKNIITGDETLYLDLSSSTNLVELEENLSNTEGFKSYNETDITISLWKFNEKELSYFKRVVGNIDSHYGNYTVNSSGTIKISLPGNYSASSALKSFSDWYKLVYGGTLSYAQIHSVLVVDSSSLDTFNENLLERGIVASHIEGPIQDSVAATNESMISGTGFVLITGGVGVVVALLGIYIDSVVVLYRRFDKFLKTKRKR